MSTVSSDHSQRERAATANNVAPNSRPTKGNQAVERPKSIPENAVFLGAGRIVRKVSATRNDIVLALGARNASLVEGRHLIQDLGGSLHKVHPQSSSRTLAQPQIKIEQGCEAEMLEGNRVPDFHRSMRGDQIVLDAGRQSGGDQRRGAGDESIEHHGHAAAGGGQDGARQAADLESAESWQARRAHRTPMADAETVPVR